MLWCDSVAPFGNPVVPDVYWMLIGSSKLSVAARSASASPSTSPDAIASHASLPRRTTSCERRALAADLVDHRRVVARLERRRGDQQADRRLVQHVLQLVAAVRRVDVDEDRADLRGGVLDEDPLGTVRRPDADAIALRDPHRAAAPRRPGRRRRSARGTSTAGRWERRRAPRGPAAGATVRSRSSPIVRPSSGTSLVPLV